MTVTSSRLHNAPPGVGERDPTKSITLRKNYARAMRKRFDRVKGLVRRSIIENDALRIRDGFIFSVFNQEKERFVFTRKEELENRFNQWLQKAIDEEVLEAEIVTGPSREVASRTEWQNKYVRRAYGKGVRDADVRLRGVGVQNQQLMQETAEEIFNKPIHAEKLNRMFSHNFEVLKTAVETGKPDVAGEVMRRELTKGIAEGLNPRDMARNIATAINQDVIEVAKSRAEAIARTETIRTHNVAALERYREFGVDNVQNRAEFSTAGDADVCPICLGMEGRTFDLRKARGIIPAHTN